MGCEHLFLGGIAQRRQASPLSLHVWSQAGAVGPNIVEGLTLCGKPIWQSGDSDVALLVGPSSHIQLFLAQHTRVFEQTLIALAALVDHMLADSTAAHVALHALRCSLLAKHRHTHTVSHTHTHTCCATCRAQYVMPGPPDSMTVSWHSYSACCISGISLRPSITFSPSRSGTGALGSFASSRNVSFIMLVQFLHYRPASWYNAPGGGWVSVAQAAMNDAAE
eukprot:4438809-Amphidinium_carterae.1